MYARDIGPGHESVVGLVDRHPTRIDLDDGKWTEDFLEREELAVAKAEDGKRSKVFENIGAFLWIGRSVSTVGEHAHERDQSEADQ